MSYSLGLANNCKVVQATTVMSYSRIAYHWITPIPFCFSPIIPEYSFTFSQKCWPVILSRAMSISAESFPNSWQGNSHVIKLSNNHFMIYKLQEVKLWSNIMIWFSIFGTTSKYNILINLHFPNHLLGLSKSYPIPHGAAFLHSKFPSEIQWKTYTFSCVQNTKRLTAKKRKP